jgi:hypothetical protein
MNAPAAEHRRALELLAGSPDDCEAEIKARVSKRLFKALAEPGRRSPPTIGPRSRSGGRSLRGRCATILDDMARLSCYDSLGSR